MWMDVKFAVKGQLFLLYTGHWFGAAYDLAGHWLFAKTGNSSILVNKARLCQSFGLKPMREGKARVIAQHWPSLFLSLSEQMFSVGI